MNCVHFTNSLSLGGTAKTLQIFCEELKKSGHTPTVLAREDGPRGKILREEGFAVHILGEDLAGFIEHLQEADVLHLHIAGTKDTVLAQKLERARKTFPILKVIATNVFGGYEPLLDAQIDQQLMVSKTLLLKFFLQNPALESKQKYGVLYNPIDVATLTRLQRKPEEIQAFRHELHIPDDAVILGRIGRPDIHKWDPLTEKVIALLAKQQCKCVFLFMSAPDSVQKRLERGRLKDYYRFLPPSSDEAKVVRFYQTIDILFHSSSIGETFGCTLAEAMALKVPVVVRSTPFTKKNLYRDNAQIEVVDDGKTGFTATSARRLVGAAASLITNLELRKEFGENGAVKVKDLYESSLLTKQLIKIYQGTDIGLLTKPTERIAYAAEYAEREQKNTDPSIFHHVADTGFIMHRKIQNHLSSSQ